MAAQNLSRKRPAPGAEPVGYPQPIQQVSGGYNNPLGHMSNDDFLQWGQGSAQSQNGYQDPSGFNVAPSAYPPNNLVPSNQIARRPINQVATLPNPNGGQWIPDPSAVPVATVNGGWEDDIGELEQKAQVAKRESQAKRKQIPPFVLKLRSFVEDPKTDDLIRWTDDGKSFVVLDEDEFAKRLIPELFKHNNYASFVRQLNMYGFHKKVGLSDNSMRASERKSKSPSEYSNPYFRRGYPDVMWLIQKPKNVTSGSKAKGRNKADSEAVEEGDEVKEEPDIESRSRPRPQLALGDGSADSMTQETLQSVQRELQLIRRQQVQISQMMAALKREHEQLYGQAVTFQDQHTRHENSINAILTFLATIYQRNVAGGDGAAGIANIFGSSLPPDSNKSGTVVDVGDYNFDQFPIVNDMNNKPFRKQPLLLTDGQNRATTMSPASSTSPMMQSSRASRKPASPQVQEVFDNDHNNNLSAFNQNSRTNVNDRNQQDMMSMIESANARNVSPNSPVVDFTNVLNDLENSRGKVPLSNTQRENVLRMINNSANQSGDNALINSTPPSGPANFGRNLANSKADLDALAKMQAQQNQSVEKLTNLLQPLSPSGSIPGIGDGQSFPPPPLDIDDIFSNNIGNSDYFSNLDSNGNYDFGTNGNGTFNWDATGGGGGGDDDDDDDDDELFADVDDNNNTTATNNNNNTNGANYGDTQDYGGSNNFLSVVDGDGGGRVESVASSEVTTPNADDFDPTVITANAAAAAATAGMSSRNKRRKLSAENGNAKNYGGRRRS